MNHLNHLLENKNIFFNFMNENYTIFQHSNLFLRDLQYAIISYFEMKEKPLNYSKAEVITKDFASRLVKANDLTHLDKKTYRVNLEVGLNKKVIETEGVENE